MTTEEWNNWSGSLRFTPERIETPQTEEEVCELVRQTADAGGTLRVVGQGHSSSPLVQTDDVLLSLEEMTGVESVDADRHQAWVRPGTNIEQLGEELLDEEMAVHNQGDINVQQIAGAIGTGTHGTGDTLGNLSTMLLGVRMVTADGRIIERNIEDDPDFIHAARVSLGTLGIFVGLRIQAEPAYKLHRQEWCTGVEECLDHLDDLIEQNRNFDFYWYPRSDEVKIRTLNPPGETPELGYAELQKENIDWAPRNLSRQRMLKFDEMEYSLPASDGPQAFRRVRDKMLAEHRRDVGWRTLYRTVAADDAWLSTSYKRPTVTISLHHNASLPFWKFFNDIEPVFHSHDGRPHWGKKHNLRADRLATLYPKFDDFRRLRRQLDPDGVFLSDYMAELLGER